MPESVNVPVPDFVTEPLPIVIAAIDEVPSLSTTRLIPDPVTPPESVRVEPESTCTSEVTDESVTTPEIAFVPDVLRIAPTSADETVAPLPVIVIASPMEMLFEMASVASFSTEVEPSAVPSAVALLIATMPDVTVVLPV